MRMRIGAFLAAAVVGALVVAPKAADGPYQFIKDVEIGGEGEHFQLLFTTERPADLQFVTDV